MEGNTIFFIGVKLKLLKIMKREWKTGGCPMTPKMWMGWQIMDMKNVQGILKALAYHEKVWTQAKRSRMFKTIGRVCQRWRRISTWRSCRLLRTSLAGRCSEMVNLGGAHVPESILQVLDFQNV